MVKILITIFLVAWTSQVWAQFYVEPAVNFGTVKLNWREVVELKTSQPTWEVKGAYRCWSGCEIACEYRSNATWQWIGSSGDLPAPLTINGQTFGKKDSKAKGQNKAGAGSQETVLVDASCLRGCVQGAWNTSRAFTPFLRCEALSFQISASGKIDGKQVEASEGFTRFYPQVGLAYVHREGPAAVSIMGAVGQRSSHIEASLNWLIRPDVWIGIGGKRAYLGFDRGRVESAVFTLTAGVTW